MDSILSSGRLLDRKGWLYFRIYKNPTEPVENELSNLNWYHQTLINVVRPVISGNPDIVAVFFGVYGPEPYDAEDETYLNMLIPPASNVVFIRLRFATKKGKKNIVKNALLASIAQHTNLVWNYETMATWNIGNDLGTRFGSNLTNQTLGFLRYWDAACRFILSILVMPGNWRNDVDVMGIPHLVNNSMGAWLRPERGPAICPDCNAHMYLRTTPMDVLFSPGAGRITTPFFLFLCPNCGRNLPVSTNI